MRPVRFIPATLALACAASAAPADVKLPAVFGDHMVLQRDAAVPFWGWADAGEQVTVTAGDAKASATAGADGKWSAKLEGLKASDEPLDVTVAGKNTLTLHDVLVGDVWVCSGPVEHGVPPRRRARRQGGNPQGRPPAIRLFVVKHQIAFEPQTDCVGKWAGVHAGNRAAFSAVGYFFARDIQEDRHVPVGMIGTYWGGTPAASWTRPKTLKAHPELAGRRAGSSRRPGTTWRSSRRITKPRLVPEWKAPARGVGTDRRQAVRGGDEAVGRRSRQGARPPANPRRPGPRPPKPEPRQPTAPDQNPYLPTVL